jgi:hypothetical protein
VGVPVIEIPDQHDTFSGRRQADEVDGLGHLFGGVTVRGTRGVRL